MIINGPGISYTEPDIGSEFVPELPDNPRPSIVALCKHCTNRILGKDELLPYEYWSFAEAATDEQADMLVRLKVRVPYTLEAAVKATGIPPGSNPCSTQRSPTWASSNTAGRIPSTGSSGSSMLVPGSAEFLNMRWSQLEEHPVFAKFFEQASKGPLSARARSCRPEAPGIVCPHSVRSAIGLRTVILHRAHQTGSTSTTASTPRVPAAVA